MSTQNEEKLLDEVRCFMRLHRYSIHTERTHCDWIKKYVQAFIGPLRRPYGHATETLYNVYGELCRAK